MKIKKLLQFYRQQQGITSLEYGLIAVAIAVLIVAVFYDKDGFIPKLQAKFGDLTEAITNAKTK